MSSLRDQPLSISIPLPGGQRWTTVTMPREMTEQEWQHWMTVLAAMKAGIVPPEPKPSVTVNITPDSPAVEAAIRDVRRRGGA